MSHEGHQEQQDAKKQTLEFTAEGAENAEESRKDEETRGCFLAVSLGDLCDDVRSFTTYENAG